MRTIDTLMLSNYSFGKKEQTFAQELLDVAAVESQVHI